MTQRTSAATNKRYTVAQVCRVWKLARSSLYAARPRLQAVRAPVRRRGPQGPCPDDELVQRIRGVVVASPFLGEGYRKVWARLRHQGLRTSRERVRRLMRQHGLSAPYAAKRTHGSKAHDGTITTSRPDVMWGTDATSVLTREGVATVFLAVDHCTSECVGLHAARHGTRHEALEPLRQGVRASFGTYDARAAAGLTLRHDHGSQFMSDHFQQELRFLGIDSSPSFVAEPECNGVAERFVRTLKEQLLWVVSFDSIEDLRVALIAFKHRYNNAWLVQKHGHRTPAEARIHLTKPAALAA